MYRRDPHRSGRNLELSRTTPTRNQKEPVMFALVLIALAVVAVVARLAAVVVTDRPLVAPRSHLHELDPQSARLRGVL